VSVLSSYYWRQAQVCMSLARGSDDPAYKHRYEDLALQFLQRAAGRIFGITVRIRIHRRRATTPTRRKGARDE
jgi:hypothetical protein